MGATINNESITFGFYYQSKEEKQRSGIDTIKYMYHTWPKTTYGKVTKTQEKHHTQESQDLSPFPADGQTGARNRESSMTKINPNKNRQKGSTKEASPWNGQ